MKPTEQSGQGTSHTLHTYSTSCEPGNLCEAAGSSLSINTESQAHLDACVQIRCPGVSTDLKKKQAQGGHVLAGAQPWACVMPLPSPPLTPALPLGLPPWWSGLEDAQAVREGGELESRCPAMPREPALHPGANVGLPSP